MASEHLSLRPEISKHNKTETESDTENQQVVARGERGGKMGKIGEGN